MSDYLQMQIATRRNRLEALDRERAKLTAELAAYEDALTSVGEGSLQIPKSHSHQRRLLPIFGDWRAILENLVEFRHFNASDVKRVAKKLFEAGKLKKAQTSDLVRAQLSLYAKKHLIKRMGGGNYRLTEQTKVALLPIGTIQMSSKDELSSAWAKADNSGPSRGG